MRRYLLFFLFAMTCSWMHSQSIVINENDGETATLNVDGLRSIQFKDGNMVATYSDGDTSTYALSDISRLDFDGTSAVNMTTMMDGKITYSPENGLVIVANSEKSHLTVFSISGTTVMEKVMESQLESIDLSGLDKGIYLLRLDGRTIKIVR